MDPNRTPEQIDLAASELLDRRVDGDAEPPVDGAVAARALRMAAAREALRTPDPHDDRVATDLVRAVLARELELPADRETPPARSVQRRDARVWAAVSAAAAVVAVVVLGGAVLFSGSDSGDESAGVAEDPVGQTAAPPTTLVPTEPGAPESGAAPSEAPTGATADADTALPAQAQDEMQAADDGTEAPPEVAAADAPTRSSTEYGSAWAVRQVFKGWLGGGAAPTPRQGP